MAPVYLMSQKSLLGLDKQRLATTNSLWNSKSTKCPTEAAMPTWTTSSTRRAPAATVCGAATRRWARTACSANTASMPSPRSTSSPPTASTRTASRTTAASATRRCPRCPRRSSAATRASASGGRGSCALSGRSSASAAAALRRGRPAGCRWQFSQSQYIYTDHRITTRKSGLEHAKSLSLASLYCARGARAL